MSGPFGVGEGPKGSDGEKGSDPLSPPPPRPPAGRSTVAWILGVVVVLFIAYVTLNTARTDAPGSRGVAAGSRLPPFAAPLAFSDLPEDADANVATRAGEGSRRPACAVRGPGILNSCELAERGPVVLAFMTTRSERCQAQVDVLERARGRYPGVGFAAVAIRGDRDDLRRIIRRRGWRLPVAYDHDGAVANAYAVAICPTITFAYRAGRVQGTALTMVGAAELARRLERLQRGP